MIPAVITDTSIMFFARGKPWTLAEDHPKFSEVKALLATGTDDADAVVRLADVRMAVEMATEGQAVLTEDALLFNGKRMTSQWREQAAAAPDSMRVLLVYTGDKVRIEGDEDAPDGIYEVGETDDTDVNKRVFVTSDEDYFGYVANSSIKEIVERVERRPVEELPADPEPVSEALPPYEAEDCGCDCNQSGMESEWNWEPDQQAYVCNGCGEVQ